MHDTSVFDCRLFIFVLVRLIDGRNATVYDVCDVIIVDVETKIFVPLLFTCFNANFV
jgi:hypothetical protein